MIPIVSSLAEHQRSTNRVPAVAVTASASRFGIELLRWSRFYSGAENDSPHAMCIAPDGSLVRARNDAGALFVSRVAAPAAGSAYNAWTNLVAVTAATGVALASKTGEVLLAFVDNAGLTLKVRTSADNGATWAAAVTVVTEASAIGSVALAFNQITGDACTFYTLGTTTTLKRLRRTAGAWAAAGTTWTNAAAVASLTGVAATHDGGDFNLIITGTAVTTTDKRVWACIMGDGNLPANAWGALNSVAEADSLSTITFAGPYVLQLGVDLRASFAHKEAGAVAFNRAYLTSPPHGTIGVSADWAEPAPHEATSANGLALAASSTAAWATTPSGVWYAPRVSTAALDARVISCRWQQDHRSTSCTVELDNHDGAFNAAPNGAYPQLLAGGSLQIALGYGSGTNGASQYGLVHEVQVDSISYGIARGRNVATLKCSGPWEALARWRAPQAWQTAAATMTRAAIFARVCGRAGVPVTGTGSADWTTYQPAFAIAAGETGASVAERLLSVASDFIRPGGLLDVRAIASTDATDANYGAAGEHPIHELHIADMAASANWVRLQGPDRYADKHQLADVYQYGPRLRLVRSMDAGTDAKASAFAANAARRDTVRDEQGELVCPVHAGQELYDVLSLTASRIGVSARKARIVALSWHYRRGGAKSPALYESTYTLGGV